MKTVKTVRQKLDECDHYAVEDVVHPKTFWKLVRAAVNDAYLAGIDDAAKAVRAEFDLRTSYSITDDADARVACAIREMWSKVRDMEGDKTKRKSTVRRILGK